LLHPDADAEGVDAARATPFYPGLLLSIATKLAQIFVWVQK
jgi:hypothetical protein